MKKIFTVIIPIYNSERYLREAFDSIVGQSIGIDAIRVVAVNDGSTDASEAICREYVNKYPDSFEYYYKQNGGVSSAVNEGLRHVDSKYVTCMGSDDRWDLDAFEKVASFFDEHYDDIDLVSTKIKIFGDLEYDHPMNYKYTESMVISLIENPDYIQTTMGNCVYKASAISGLRLDEGLRAHEDIYFNSLFLLTREKYGVVSESSYWYRKDSAGNSLSLNLRNDRYWYIDIPQKIYYPLIQKSIELCGEVTPFIQEVLLYTNKWRLKTRNQNHLLTEEEKKEYYKMIRDVAQVIEDKRIMSTRNLTIPYKDNLLSVKYGCNIFENSIITDDGKLIFKGNTVFSASGLGQAKITHVFDDGEYLNIEIKTNCKLAGDICDIFIELEGEDIITPNTFRVQEEDIFSFDEKLILPGTHATFKMRRRDSMRFKFFSQLYGQPQRYYIRVSCSTDIVIKNNKDVIMRVEKKMPANTDTERQLVLTDRYSLSY